MEHLIRGVGRRGSSRVRVYLLLRMGIVMMVSGFVVNFMVRGC
jgi:hypothetical protein